MLSDWRESDLFTEQEQLVLEYGEKMTITGETVDDKFFAKLKAMFNDAEMTRLTSFLGIGARDGDFDHIVNASTAVAMPDDWAAQARVALAPSYDAVAARFGVAVPADWHAAPGIARAAQ